MSLSQALNQFAQNLGRYRHATGINGSQGIFQSKRTAAE